MPDPCTKFEVSSVSRCGDITWGAKFYKGLSDFVGDPGLVGSGPVWSVRWNLAIS